MYLPKTLSYTIAHATWRRLRVAFLIAALAAIGTAAVGLARFAAEIGGPFGGFAWLHGWRDQYYVYPITPLGWPGLDAGLAPLDIIVAVNDRPPADLPEVFNRVGDLVKYEVQREEQRLVVNGPVVPFTVYMWWELLGPFALGGLSAVIVAQLLLRWSSDRGLVLIASFLLIAGVMLLGKINSPDIHVEHRASPIEILIEAFGYPLAGAVTWHFMLVFPRPRPVLFRHRQLVHAIYALALILGAASAVAARPVGHVRALEVYTYPAVLVFALSGLVASVIGVGAAYRSATLAQDAVTAYKVRRLAAAWLTGVALYGYLGIAIHVAPRWMPFITELLASMTIIYPVLLAYALLNVLQVEELRRQISAAEAMRDEMRELRATREQVLHQVADDLHAYVLPDIRGLQMSAQAATHRGRPLDAVYVTQVLDNVYRVARRIMEGAKPINLQQDQLLPSVRRMLHDLEVAMPGLAVQLEVGAWHEDFSLAVKEELYRIIQTAVTNVRDHAQAQHLLVVLSLDDEHAMSTICDDGQGFDVTAVLGPDTDAGRRRMGVRSIQARAEALGGTALIEGGPQGVRISASVPLVPPRSDLPAGKPGEEE